MNISDNQTVDTGLQEFVSARTMQEQSHGLTLLLKRKALHGASRDSAFLQAVDRLRSEAVHGNPTDRLLAVSMLAKIAGLVRALRSQVKMLLVEALREPLPPLQVLVDPDDRYYVATFWRFYAPAWASDYIGASLVSEESAENTRRELAEGLVETTATLDEAVSVLGGKIGAVQFATEDPRTSVARRARRVLAAFSHALLRAKGKNLGNNFGNALRDLLRLPFSRVSLGSDPKPIAELATEVITLISTVVRFRLASAFESSTYLALFTIRDWFDSKGWSTFVETPDARTLADDIADALEIGVKSGNPDKGLYEALLLIEGSRQIFQQRLQAVIERNPGLSEEMVSWLTGQRVVHGAALATESQIVRIEKRLASLMLDAADAASALQEISTELIPELKMFPSISSGSLGALVPTIRRMLSTIDDLAESRDFATFGTVGEEVPFSPLTHELMRSEDMGSVQVRIVRPGVSVAKEDGSRFVVQKALVTSL
jgi:hypothetical protein